MTDPDLLRAVEAALPGLGSFDRDVYLHARLRILRGEALRPHQRHYLHRVLGLASRLPNTTQKEPTPCPRA